MVAELHFRVVAEVVVRRDHQKIAGNFKEVAQGVELVGIQALAGAEGVEADDDESVEAGDELARERRVGPVGRDSLHFQDRRAGGDAGELDEVDEVAAQDVVEEPADALVEAPRFGQFGIVRIKDPPALE